MNKKICILNDTSRDIGHFGCNSVMENLKKLCYYNQLEVLFIDNDTNPNFDCKEYIQKIKNLDFVIVNGEGCLHDNKCLDIYKKCQLAKELNKKIFLINTVWQNNEETKKYLNLFDILSTRESFSFNQAINDGAKNIFCVGDLSFYSFPEIYKNKNKPIKNIAIIDRS